MTQVQDRYQSYYTKSSPLVNYMLNQLSLDGELRVFEPCAGDGVFIDALLEKNPFIHLDACELDIAAFTLLQNKYCLNKNIHLKNSDTLLDDELLLYSRSGGMYNGIIANPPYGAWQDYEKRQNLKKLYPHLYVKETYTLFLYLCINLLAEGGILVFITPDTFLNLHMHTPLREHILTKTKVKEIALFPSTFFPNVSFGYSDLAIITLEKSSEKEKCLTNSLNIYTGYKQVNDLPNGKYGKKYSFTQHEVYKHADHAFFISDKPVNRVLNTRSTCIGDIADCVTGIYTGDDKKYLRPASPHVKRGKTRQALDNNLINPNYLTNPDLLDGLETEQCFVPILKGGAVKYLKSDEWYIDWSKEAVRHYKTGKKARFQNSKYYFKCGLGIPMVSSSQVTAALIESKLFDQSIVGVFPKDPIWTYYLLAFFNSPTCNMLLRTINPSANNSANYIKKIPFLSPGATDLEFITSKVKEILSSLKDKKEYLKEAEQEINEAIKGLYGF